MAFTIEEMTAKERLEKLVRSYTDSPQFAQDGWADLAEVNQASRDAVLGRLDEEERAAGTTPGWPRAARPR